MHATNSAQLVGREKDKAVQSLPLLVLGESRIGICWCHSQRNLRVQLEDRGFSTPSILGVICKRGRNERQ